MRFGRRKLRVSCGARNRKGEPCRCKLLLNGRLCKFHGGKSLSAQDKARITKATGRVFLKTGPKTPEGKARALANLARGRLPKLKRGSLLALETGGPTASHLPAGGTK